MKEAEKRSLRRGAAIQIAAGIASSDLCGDAASVADAALGFAEAVVAALESREEAEDEAVGKMLAVTRQMTDAKAADAKAGVETVEAH